MRSHESSHSSSFPTAQRSQKVIDDDLLAVAEAVGVVRHSTNVVGE